MDKEQIQELMEKATKGPWSYDPPTKNVKKNPARRLPAVMKKDADNYFTIVECRRDSPYQSEDIANGLFIAALHDIAQTALDALQRVEELEEKLGMRGECSCRERVHRHHPTCNHHPDQS